MWGAFLGTLPDLDVLIPLDGPVEDFVYHRGFSHSLFLLALVSPLVAWLITRTHPDSRNRFREWWLLVFLVLEIGVLLYLLTVYGTQVLWPFDTTPPGVARAPHHRPAVHPADRRVRVGGVVPEQKELPVHFLGGVEMACDCKAREEIAFCISLRSYIFWLKA